MAIYQCWFTARGLVQNAIEQKPAKKAVNVQRAPEEGRAGYLL